MSASNGDPFVAVNPVNRNTEALATAYVYLESDPIISHWVSGPTGSITTTVPKQLGFDHNGNLKIAAGSRNIVTAGIRPVFWVSDNIAIQGVAAFSYIDNVRSASSRGWQ